jgi:hypothetical protein
MKTNSRYCVDFKATNFWAKDLPVPRHHGQLTLVVVVSHFNTRSLRMNLLVCTRSQTLQSNPVPEEVPRQRGVSVTPHKWHHLTGSAPSAIENLKRGDRGVSLRGPSLAYLWCPTTFGYRWSTHASVMWSAPRYPEPERCCWRGLLWLVNLFANGRLVGGFVQELVYILSLSELVQGMSISYNLVC